MLYHLAFSSKVSGNMLVAASVDGIVCDLAVLHSKPESKPAVDQAEMSRMQLDFVHLKQSRDGPKTHL